MFSYETLLASYVSGFRIIVMGVITVQLSRAQIIPVTLSVLFLLHCSARWPFGSPYTFPQHGNVVTSSRADAIFGEEALLLDKLSENYLRVKCGFLWSFVKLSVINIEQLAEQKIDDFFFQTNTLEYCEVICPRMFGFLVVIFSPLSIL